MWFLSFLQLGLVATVFYSPVTATDRAVHYASALELEFSDGSQGWRHFNGPGEFSASVFVLALEKSMTISQMSNDKNVVDSDEALLSIWEHDSGLSAEELRHVKFNNIDLDSDVQVLDEAFKKFDYDPRKPSNYKIPAITVRESDILYSAIWDSLHTTSFGKDAIKMSTRYRETKNLYIESFDFGRTGRDERWARVNFAAKGY